MQKYVLEFPLEHAGSIVKVILVRELSVADIEAVAPGWLSSGKAYPDDLLNATLTLFGRLTDLPPELVDELDWADLQQLGELFAEMMKAHQNR